MGPYAPHSAEAPATGVRHQTTVVRPVLVSSADSAAAPPPQPLVLRGDDVSPFRFCRDVHAVCLWDDKGPAKIHQALKEDILDFIKQAQAVSFFLVFHLKLFL